MHKLLVLVLLSITIVTSIVTARPQQQQQPRAGIADRRRGYLSELINKHNNNKDKDKKKATSSKQTTALRQVSPPPPLKYDELIFAEYWRGNNNSNGGNNNTVNNATWQYEEGFIRNNELQYYTTSTANTFVQDGALHIVARNNTPVYVNGRLVTAITSGSIYTNRTFDIADSAGLRVVFTARLPCLNGLPGSWPAGWLLGVPDYNYPKVHRGWPWFGEIDILESVSYLSNTSGASMHTTCHVEDYNGWRGNPAGGAKFIRNVASEWHTYEALWTHTHIEFKIDGQTIYVYQNDGTCERASWPFSDDKMQLKFNLAIGGLWGGHKGVDPAIFPARFEVGPVFIYRARNNNSSTTPHRPCTRNYERLTLTTDVFQYSIMRDLFSQSPLWMRIFNNTLTQNLITACFGSNSNNNNNNGDVYRDKLYVQSIGLDYYSSNQLMRPDASTGRPVNIVINVSLVNISLPTFMMVIKQRAETWMRLNQKSSDTNNIFGLLRQSGFSVTGIHFGGAPYTELGLPYATLLANQKQHSATERFSAAFYDFGGSSVAYLDSTVWNENDGNRADVARSGLDQVDTSRADGGELVVGYIVNGEWLKYSRVFVPALVKNNSWSSNSNNHSNSNGNSSSNTGLAVAANISVTFANGDPYDPAWIVVELTRLAYVCNNNQQAWLGNGSNSNNHSSSSNTTWNSTVTLWLELPPTGGWDIFMNSTLVSDYAPGIGGQVHLPHDPSCDAVYSMKFNFQSSAVLKHIAISTAAVNGTLNPPSGLFENPFETKSSAMLRKDKEPTNFLLFVAGCLALVALVFVTVVLAARIVKARSVGRVMMRNEAQEEKEHLVAF